MKHKTKTSASQRSPSVLMDDVLAAVSTIAAEDEMVSAEAKAARKIANWWRHTKKRKAGLVTSKFPPALAVSEDDAVGADLFKAKIRQVFCLSLVAGRGL